MVRIIHQKDKYNGEIVGEYWLLDGVGYREGKPLMNIGFEWIPGPDGGIWQAPNKRTMDALVLKGIEVVEVGNGHN